MRRFASVCHENLYRCQFFSKCWSFWVGNERICDCYFLCTYWIFFYSFRFYGFFTLKINRTIIHSSDQTNYGWVYCYKLCIIIVLCKFHIIRMYETMNIWYNIRIEDKMCPIFYANPTRALSQRVSIDKSAHVPQLERRRRHQPNDLIILHTF